MEINHRFWSKVNKLSNSDGGCWIWTARRHRSGYGQFKREGKQRYAHRVAYELTYSVFNENMRVLHKCDTPSCVRPDHLFLGTQQDNVRDMYTKGRGVDNSGDKHGNAKLTEADVKYIRKMLEFGFVQTDIAEHFHITKSHVSKIKHNKIWKHLTNE